MHNVIFYSLSPLYWKLWLKHKETSKADGFEKASCNQKKSKKNMSHTDVVLGKKFFDLSCQAFKYSVKTWNKKPNNLFTVI